MDFSKKKINISNQDDFNNEFNENSDSEENEENKLVNQEENDTNNKKYNQNDNNVHRKYSNINDNKNNKLYYKKRDNYYYYIAAEKKETLTNIMSEILNLHNVEHIKDELVSVIKDEDERDICTLSKYCLEKIKELKELTNYITRKLYGVSSIFSSKTRKYYFIIPTEEDFNYYDRNRGNYMGPYNRNNRKYNPNSYRENNYV